jgi:hypothetical protein
MKWDQIEVKWSTMARRMRSDLPRTSQVGSELGPDEDPPLTPPGDLPEPPLPEVKTSRVR